MVTPFLLTDLSQTPFSEVLRRLSAERRSGDLDVRAGKTAKTVYFDHGRVVFAASNLKKDRLGESLVAMGRITREEFETASALMRGDRRKRFGDALVQAGTVEKSELGKLVARQVKRIVLSLFELPEAASSFEDRPCAVPIEYMVSLSVHRLLYAGIKTINLESLVVRGLGNLDRWVELTAVPPFVFGLRKCSAEEREILEMAKRRVTLRRLCWAPGGISFPRARATYAFLASGVLQEVEQSTARQPVVQTETSTFLLSTLQRRPDPTLREVIRREVEAELARSAQLDREKWLRVSRTAPHEQLVKALEGKMEHYHMLLDAVADDSGLKTDIELILGRASSMLRLARHTAQHTEVLAPDGAPSADAATSRGAARGEPAPSQPGASPAAASAPPATAADRPDITAVGIGANTAHLILEAQTRMMVGDFGNAVKAFTKVVEMEPDCAAHYVRLALAMARHPPTHKQAERAFFEAARLEPENPDIHYQLAVFYKQMKVRSRAVSELRVAVHLDPRHKKARDALESISPKDPVLTSLRKSVG